MYYKPLFSFFYLQGKSNLEHFKALFLLYVYNQQVLNFKEKITFWNWTFLILFLYMLTPEDFFIFHKITQSD